MPMNVTVKLFARARDLAGADAVVLDLPDGARVAELRAALVERVPTMKALAPQLFIAVNNDYADDARPLAPRDEIACFPPVSGG